MSVGRIVTENKMKSVLAFQFGQYAPHTALTHTHTNVYIPNNTLPYITSKLIVYECLVYI